MEDAKTFGISLLTILYLEIPFTDMYFFGMVNKVTQILIALLTIAYLSIKIIHKLKHK